MGFSIASFYGSNDIGKEAVARMQNSTTEYANKIANKSNSISSASVNSTNKNSKKPSKQAIFSHKNTFNKKRSNKVRKRNEFKFYSVMEFWDTFRTDNDCIDYLEELIWDRQPESPFDPTSKVYKCKNRKYKCKNTNKYFTVLTGTIFEGSRIPLRCWFYALYCLTNIKIGKSALQISKDIHISHYRTLKMLHKIRECILGAENYNVMDGIVLTDETFVGGKDKNRHWNKKAKYAKENDDRNFVDKIPVVGYMNADGLLTARVVPSVSANTLLNCALTFIKPGSTVYSDDWKGYKDFHKYYEHFFVEHGKRKYVNGKVTTNKLEGAWTQLKRISSTYHHVSPKYLQLYINEFVFRYNTLRMKDADRFIWGLQLSKKQEAA